MVSPSKVSELSRYLDAFVEHVVWQQEKTPCEMVGPQEAKVLFVLGHRGPMIMSQLSERIQLSLSSATGIVDKLVEKKYVERRRSEEDRRIVQVEITGEGREIYKMIHEAHAEMGKTMLSALNDVEQNTFLKLFHKIVGQFVAPKIPQEV